MAKHMTVHVLFTATHVLVIAAADVPHQHFEAVAA
jgi:hypothetical protein